MRRTGYVVLVGWLFLQAGVAGLIAHAWTFEELMSKSDLIVIAECLATRDAGIKTEFPDLRPRFPVVEMSSTFKVLSTLKGTPLRGILVLRYYRQDTDRLPGPILNAPLGLDFSRGPTTVYLLFLARESADLFAPTSGHVFPEFSIFALPKGPLTLFPR